LENSSGTNVDSQKMKLVLAIKAEKFEVDLVAGCLRVNGKNIKENKYVKVQYINTYIDNNFYYFIFSWVVIIHLNWNVTVSLN